MAQKNDGGTAFPLQEHHDDGTHCADWSGMSLRDYFAAQWAIGISATLKGNADFAAHATEAYTFADAMLAARAKEPPDAP